MDEKIWANPEVKGTLLKMAIAAVIVSVLAFFYFNFLFFSFNKGLIDKNLAAVGILAMKHPELKEDIALAIAGEASPEEMERGIAAAREYGYTEELPVSFTPLVSSFRLKSMIGTELTLILAFIAAALIIYGILRKFFSRIRQAADAAERIVEGDFSIKLYEHDEGDFSKLGHQFNQMTKRLELSIEALKKEKVFLKNIVSDISHQLKTPLSSVKVFNEIMQSDRTEQEDRQRFLVKSGEQIERMEWLIQNLLLMARLETGAIEFIKEDKPLNLTVEAAVESLRDKWENKGLKVSIRKETGEIRLKHDERWLEEAVTNIVKNSIEHTAAGGHIEIELSSTPLMAKIEIRDNGEGISREDLPHIFERFYRGRNKAPGSGTGIGLALAKGIIENQGGMIGVSSTQGQGTSFTIIFPNITKL